MLAVGVLGFGLEGFLELALASFVLLMRLSALAGRPGGVDPVAGWGSRPPPGSFSSAHELIGPAIGGTRARQVDLASLLAAGMHRRRLWSRRSCGNGS
ncbi:hypothetical protein [Pengzhenrongella sp.]|uniref:hypothetical protein n=1 Tax=Pengzhenrongella sp. TaxID=2888820 RepID=UPI002F92F3E0